MEENQWANLLEDIFEERAILLLGHGFVPSAYEQAEKKLSDTLQDKLLHIHQQDALFLFSNSDAKSSAQSKFASVFKNMEQDDSVLKKIVELPFRLMISANPDKALVDTFTKYRQKLQFDYFSAFNKEKLVALERPSVENPILYNLCGSVEDEESLILDYDDLFNLLKSLLADVNVPDQLRITLKKAKTFIFVGFHFERWYTQLFMRYLNMYDKAFTNNSSNFVVKTSFQNNDLQQFFIDQFQVKYIGADLSFFEELHERFSKKHPEKIRKIVEALSPTATSIIQLIERNDIASAIQMIKIFKAQLSDDDATILILQESELNRIEAERETIATEYYDLTLRQIKSKLIHLAKKLN